MSIFTKCIEIFSTLLYCVAFAMLLALLGQWVYTLYKKQLVRKKRGFYLRKKLELEFQKNKVVLKQVENELKIISLENNYLKIENEALRRELPLYSEMRSEMLNNCIRLEVDNFDLQVELKAKCKEIKELQQDIHLLEFDLKKQIVRNQQVVEDLEISTNAVFQVQGISFEELAELPSIMKGTSKTTDIDSAIIVAKSSGTILFEQMQEQIKGSKLEIGALIDRIEKKLNKGGADTRNAETNFFNKTGFSIYDFLPIKTT